MLSIQTRRFSVSTFCLIAWISPAAGEAAELQKAARSKCEGAQLAGCDSPTPTDPYPLIAAG